MKVKVRKKTDPADSDRARVESPEEAEQNQSSPEICDGSVRLQPLREQQTAAWILAELKSRGSEPRKFIQAYCALLLLRFGEWLTAEERAIAEFEGTAGPEE